MPDEEISDAWTTLHASTPSGWFVGRPAYDERRDQWSIYAFDTRERPRIGGRSREWVAVARNEAGVLREMARCLAEFGLGRVPK